MADTSIANKVHFQVSTLSHHHLSYLQAYLFLMEASLDLCLSDNRFWGIKIQILVFPM